MKKNIFLFIIFVAAHISLGILIRYFSFFSTIHAYVIFLVGVFFVFYKKPTNLIILMGYCVSSELLWRATNADVFWEFGKYLIILFGLIGIIKFSSYFPVYKLPIIYFVLLTPSIFLLPYFDREAISFNLAGPLALAVTTVFLGRTELYRKDFRNLLLFMIYPIISIGVLVLFGIIQTDSLVFSSRSLLVTSANFGPNQISSILALGSFLGFIFVIYFWRKNKIRNSILVISIWLLAQSILTFSRGGFWTSIISIFIVGLFLSSDRERRIKFFSLGLSIFAIFYFMIFPIFNNITSGTISQRFSDLGSTGRLEIVLSDLVIFTRYPVFGVGPNQSRPYHEIYFRESNAHTEFSRMLSEHGVFGAVSLVILLTMAIQRIISEKKTTNRALIVGFIAWSFLFMLHSATRLVAPSFMFGLAFGNYFLDLESSKKSKTDSKILIG